MDAAPRNLVQNRAGNRCEYCLIHQDQDAFFTFPVDHIIALQHGGKTEADKSLSELLSMQFSQGAEHRELSIPRLANSYGCFTPDETIGSRWSHFLGDGGRVLELLDTHPRRVYRYDLSVLK